jgi:hypothetical protein
LWKLKEGSRRLQHLVGSKDGQLGKLAVLKEDKGTMTLDERNPKLQTITSRSLQLAAPLQPSSPNQDSLHFARPSRLFQPSTPGQVTQLPSPIGHAQAENRINSSCNEVEDR